VAIKKKNGDQKQKGRTKRKEREHNNGRKDRPSAGVLVRLLSKKVWVVMATRNAIIGSDWTTKLRKEKMHE